MSSVPMAERIRAALTIVGIVAVVAMGVLFLTGGTEAIADFLHVSERDVIPIALGVLVGAWLLWRAVTLSRRPD